MSDYISEAEEYFDLIVECAKRLTSQRKPGESVQTFWRQLVGKEWRNTYQHMTRGGAEFGVWNNNGFRRATALRFAALSRMAAMAAWDIGIQAEDGEDQPERVAKAFIVMGEQQSPRIR
jgi:hypothetical protein